MKIEIREYMRGLIILFMCLIFLNIKSQEIQIISTDIVIDNKEHNILPHYELFTINLTNNYYIYQLMNDGIILYSYESKIHKYTVENGIVNFIVDDFYLELHVNSNSCVFFDINYSRFKWIGNCSIDFSIMLVK